MFGAASAQDGVKLARQQTEDMEKQGMRVGAGPLGDDFSTAAGEDGLFSC